MPEVITLDVVDCPDGGAVRALRRMRGLRGGMLPGLRHLIRMRTQQFVPTYRPPFTPRRVAALAVWDVDADIEANRRLLFPGGGREHWQVVGEVTRGAFSGPWLGWQPDNDGARPLEPDEPALILISGNLRPRAVPGFMRDGIGAVGQAFEHTGYLGGVTLNSEALNMTSCSAWRTYADARDYAFSKGRHTEAIRRARRLHRHTGEWFLRVRPLASGGTLCGRDPFAGLLRARVAA